MPSVLSEDPQNSAPRDAGGELGTSASGAISVAPGCAQPEGARPATLDKKLKALKSS